MRKNSAPIRTILPDSKFNDVRVAKLINMIMYDGKKGIAQSIVYDAFDKVQEKTKKGAMEVFEEALKNIGPSIELKVKRVAGSNYQVPTEVNTQRKVVLALR
jgi:small subunit ribosomal protein S7